MVECVDTSSAWSPLKRLNDYVPKSLPITAIQFHVLETAEGRVLASEYPTKAKMLVLLLVLNHAVQRWGWLLPPADVR